MEMSSNDFSYLETPSQSLASMFQDRLSLSLGTNIVGDSKLKQSLFTIRKTLRHLWIIPNLCYLCSVDGKPKHGLQHTCLQYGGWSAKNALETHTLLRETKQNKTEWPDNALDHPRALTEISIELSIFLSCLFNCYDKILWWRQLLE